MSAILFPDFGQAFSQAEGVLNNRAQRNFLEGERSAKESAAPFIQKALQGDQGALNEVATRHPDTFLKLAPLLERMDAGKRAKVKEDADFITQNGMAILNAAPEQQPQLYARVRQEAEASGRNVSQWPTTYDPGWVKFNVDKAMPFSEHFKRNAEQPTPMAPLGGGTATTGGGVNPNNIGNVRPVGGGPSAGFQQPASFDDGVRLAVNNVKAYPAKFNGGQPMTLLQIGERWAPRGDGANDPQQWARNVGSIGGLDPTKPLDLNDPATAAAFARGVHGAEHGANKAQPVEAYARILAGGAPPGMAQGDGGPPSSPAGSGPQPQQAQAREVLTIRQFVHSQIPGAAPLTVNGMPAYDKNGRLGIQLPNGQRDFIDVPKPKEPGVDKGLFGDSLTGRALTALRTLDPATQDYAAAYAILSKPQVISDGAGGQQVIQPMDLTMFPKPTFGGGGQPAGGGAPVPAGVTPPGGPQPTQIPGGGTVVNLPGKGKPIDNSARDDLKKISDTALELPKLVESFDPSFGGFVMESKGDVDNWMKRNLPDSLGGKDEKGQAQWWQRYANFANLERNKLFGSALTPGETAAFNAAMVNPGMKSDQIKTNLERQSEIARKALSRVANSLKASGYNAEAIEILIGTPFSGLPDPMGAVPQASPKPGSAEQGRDEFNASKAPKPGTVEQGYRFKGGNPADKSSWERVQ